MCYHVDEPRSSSAHFEKTCPNFVSNSPMLATPYSHAFTIFSTKTVLFPVCPSCRSCRNTFKALTRSFCNESMIRFHSVSDSRPPKRWLDAFSSSLELVCADDNSSFAFNIFSTVEVATPILRKIQDWQS